MKVIFSQSANDLGPCLGSPKYMNSEFEIRTKSGDAYCVFAADSNQVIDIISASIDVDEIATIELIDSLNGER